MGNLKPSPETEKEYRSFFDFLPEGTLVLAHNIPACAALVGKRMEKAREDFSALKENSPLKHLPPEELFLDEGEFRRGFARHRVLELSQRPFFDGACELDSGIVPQAVFHRNFPLLGQTPPEGSPPGLATALFCPPRPPRARRPPPPMRPACSPLPRCAPHPPLPMLSLRCEAYARCILLRSSILTRPSVGSIITFPAKKWKSAGLFPAVLIFAKRFVQL